MCVCPLIFWWCVYLREQHTLRYTRVLPRSMSKILKEQST